MSSKILVERCYGRYRGEKPIKGRTTFKIYDTTFEYEFPVCARYVLDESKYTELNQEDNIIARGLIIPESIGIGEEISHKGIWIFHYPEDREKIIEVVNSLEIHERLHDNCSFLDHYSQFRVHDNMGHDFGTLEYIRYSFGQAGQQILFN